MEETTPNQLIPNTLYFEYICLEKKDPFELRKIKALKDEHIGKYYGSIMVSSIEKLMYQQPGYRESIRSSLGEYGAVGRFKFNDKPDALLIWDIQPKSDPPFEFVRVEPGCEILEEKLENFFSFFRNLANGITQPYHGRITSPTFDFNINPVRLQYQESEKTFRFSFSFKKERRSITRKLIVPE